MYRLVDKCKNTQTNLQLLEIFFAPKLTLFCMAISWVPIRIYCQNIGMEFGIEKYSILIMKSEKRKIAEGKELPNQKSTRTFEEKENFKYLRILEADTIKQTEMKEKVRKEIAKRTRKLLETKLCRRNLFKGTKTWVVPFCKILSTILKMNKGGT